MHPRISLVIPVFNEQDNLPELMTRGMGLLGEYIGRIYHDVRARPRHFVERVVGREVSGSAYRSGREAEVDA